MKNTKKLAAMIAALALSACSIAPVMGMTASAVDAGKISFTGEVADSGHTYTAYQIFSGTVEVKDGKTQLTGIQWANATGADNFLTALKADGTIGSDFADCSNAAEVAKVLGGYNNNSAQAKAFAKLVVAQKANLTQVNTTPAATIDAADDGYYVIVEAPLSGTPENSAMTSYLLAVYNATEGAEISVKSSVPTVIKKIKENTNISVGTKDDRMVDYEIPANYNDTADFSIGDTVPFQIVGSMPGNIADYATYKYIFHDTLDSQFTLADDFNAYGVTVKIGDKELAGYTVTSTNNAITITFNDIKAAAKEASVELTSESKVVVDYNATLSDAAVIGRNGQKNKVYLEYSNNPNVGGEGETDTTSKTTEDTVIAFTYELDVTKIDGANSELKLDGAVFKLKATDGEHADQWVQVNADGKVSGWGTEEDASELTSANGGIFKVIGLDDGNYSLKETEAPGGYNLLTDPIAFEIIADTSNSQSDNTIEGDELKTLQIKVGSDAAKDGALTSGVVAMDVENNSGSTLPSTGGMGTTLFYLGGGAMVAAAGVFLITKKRMGKSEN